MLHSLLRRLGLARLALLAVIPSSGGERVTGPFKGYFIAVYAAPCAPHRYLAYYKICNGAPASYWEACCLVKGRGGEASADLQAALLAAEAQARSEICNLPSLQRLAVWRERRSFYLFEWNAILTGRTLPGWEVA